MQLPGTLTLQAAAISAGVALLVGLSGGIYGAHEYYAPRLELANDHVKTLGDDIKAQNDGIEKLAAAARAREDAASAAVAAAQAAGAKQQARAQQIMSRQKPANQDDCQAANDLITQELGQ